MSKLFCFLLTICSFSSASRANIEKVLVYNLVNGGQITVLSQKPLEERDSISDAREVIEVVSKIAKYSPEIRLKFAYEAPHGHFKQNLNILVPGVMCVYKNLKFDEKLSEKNSEKNAQVDAGIFGVISNIALTVGEEDKIILSLNQIYADKLDVLIQENSVSNDRVYFASLNDFIGLFEGKTLRDSYFPARDRI